MQPGARRAHRIGAIGLQRGMRHAAHMPQLGEDLALLGMHCIGHHFPAGDLLLRPDAGHIDVALALLRDGSALADNQARARALGVIGCRQCIRHASRIAGAGHRCHDDAVAQLGVAEIEGLEDL